MNQWRKPMLLGGALIALALAFAGGLSLPPLNQVHAAPDLQLSPLSPLTTTNAASAVTVTLTTTATTAGLITSTVVTASEPLTAGGIVITEPVVDTTAVAPVEMTSPLTVSVPVETPARAVGPSGPFERPMAGIWSLPARIASGQISLILVAALFVGLFTVIGLVLTRRS